MVDQKNKNGIPSGYPNIVYYKKFLALDALAKILANTNEQNPNKQHRIFCTNYATKDESNHATKNESNHATKDESNHATKDESNHATKDESNHAIKDKRVVFQFHIKTIRDVFDDIVNDRCENYYEYCLHMNRGIVKLFFDLDYSPDKTDINKNGVEKIRSEYEQKMKILMSDIINILNENYDQQISKKFSDVLFMKSDGDEKFSYHIIFTNVIFESMSHLKYFIDMLPEKIKENIDTSVYRVGAFRTLWSRKMNSYKELQDKKLFGTLKDNRLNVIKIKNSVDFVSETENKYKLFTQSLLLFTPKNHRIVNIIIPEEVQHKFVSKVRIEDDAIVYREVREKKARTYSMPMYIDFVIDRKEAIKIIKKTTVINVLMIESIVMGLSGKRYENRDYWIHVGMSLYNINVNFFYLFEQFSEQSVLKYSEDNCVAVWNSFRKFSGGFSIGTLFFYLKEDNVSLFNDLYKHYNVSFLDLEPRRFTTTKINVRYLLDKNVKLERVTKNDGDCTDNDRMINHLIDFHETATKALCVLSNYNTGKTTMLKKFFSKYDGEYKKILWISYRQTLTNDIHGNFAEYGFKSYLDEDIDYKCNRLVIQIESLKKLLMRVGNACNDVIEEDEIDGCIWNNDESFSLPTYDLIVMDEIESLLNQFNSPTLDFATGVFYCVFNKLCIQSKKIIALDGDFGNRSYEFIKQFPHKIIENMNREANDKIFTFTKNENYFLGNIIKKIINKKNIVIVCMSEKDATYYYNLITEKSGQKICFEHLTTSDSTPPKQLIITNSKASNMCNENCIYDDNMQYVLDKNDVLLHSGQTSDVLKDYLKDVNNMWKRKVIIYTPHIESGVNFDVLHFDAMFVKLCSGSTSQRGLKQMMSRVRKMTDKNVLMCANRMSMTACSYKNYTFIKDIDKDNDVSVQHLENDNQCNIVNKKGVFYKISVYNEQEKRNKNSSIFVPTLIEMLIKSGHQVIDFDGDNTQLCINKDTNDKLLLDKSYVCDEIYDELKTRARNNIASSDDKLIIRYNKICRYYNTRIVDKKLLKHYTKYPDALNGYMSLLDERNIKQPKCEDDIDTYLSKGDNTTLKKNKECIQLIKQLIIDMGFNMAFHSYEHDQIYFDERIDYCLAKSEIFTKLHETCLLFDISTKHVLSDFTHPLGYLGCSNGTKDKDKYVRFMESHIVNKNNNQDDATHVLYAPLSSNMPKGTLFSIKGLDYEKFMKLYKMTVRKNLFHPHIAEYYKQIGPLIINISYGLLRKNMNWQKHDEYIIYIVKKIHYYIKKYFDIDETILKAFVFKNTRESSDIYYDGFQIIYPDLSINSSERYFLFSVVADEIKQENGFDTIPFEENTLRFYTSAIDSHGIPMYRSCEKTRHLIKIYDNKLNTDSTENYDTDELISILSIRRFTDEDTICLRYKYLNSRKLLCRIEKITNTYSRFRSFTNVGVGVGAGAGTGAGTGTSTSDNNKGEKKSNNKGNVNSKNIDEDFERQKMKRQNFLRFVNALLCRYGLKIQWFYNMNHNKHTRQKDKTYFYKLIFIDNIDEFLFMRQFNGNFFYDIHREFSCAEVKVWDYLFCSLEKGLKMPRINWLDMPHTEHDYIHPIRDAFINVNKWSMSCGLKKINDDTIKMILNEIRNCKDNCGKNGDDDDDVVVNNNDDSNKKSIVAKKNKISNCVNMFMLK